MNLLHFLIKYSQGFLSFDPMELNVKLRGGTELEQRQAKIILPAIERHHLMLVSLLLWNAAANEILPLFLDELLPPYAAIILSITLVLLVGGNAQQHCFLFHDKI